MRTGVVLVALLALSAVATARSAPGERFNGTLTGTTGTLAGAHATTTVTALYGRARPHSRGAPLKLVFSRARCPATGPCLHLAGTLRGTITDRPEPSHIPTGDIGSTSDVRLSGRLDAVGRTTARGTISTAGNCNCPRRSLELTLHTARGMVTLAASHN